MAGLMAVCGLAGAFMQKTPVFAVQTVTTQNVMYTGTGVNVTPPSVEAESAILMDAVTGTVLYEKNIHVKQYPASITKIMTALLTQENCAMDEVVTFSHNAVFGIERGSSNIGIDENETLSVKDALYALMLASANEVAVGLAEHVGGSVENFSEMMNARALELGCEGTHFTNPNGLPDEAHYTTAYDMALMARAFFAYENLCTISGTPTYHINATPTQPDEIDLTNHNKMLSGKYYYDGLIGGKNGYTSVARQTLVTCAERDGVKLVCVVMKDESPDHYTDSAALFDYGFAKYEALKAVNVLSAKEMEELACTAAYEASGENYQVIDEEAGLSETLLVPKGTDASEITYASEFDVSASEVTIRFECNGENAGSVVIPVYAVEQFEGDAMLVDGPAGSPVMMSDLGKIKDSGEEKSGKDVLAGIFRVIGIVLLSLGAVAALLALVLWKRIKEEQERVRRRRELMERRRRRQEAERMENAEEV